MRELLTADELAERLKVKPETVLEWGRAGRIPHFRLTPKVVRFDPTAVMAAIAAQQSDRKAVALAS